MTLLAAQKETMTLTELIHAVMEATGLRAQYEKEDTEEARSRLENIDEFVALTDDDGNVVATATVTASDVQTITCSFPTPPEPGTYTLVVSCRNGARTSLAPAVSKLKNVTVKAA